MTAYATSAELRLYLRHTEPFTPEEEDQAELLLDLATGAVEEECGQSLWSSTDTVLLDGTGTRKLVLPRWPVTAVTAVTLTDDGTVLAEGTDRDYTWSASGILYRRGSCWPCEPQAVEATVTAGLPAAPDGVRRIVLRLAAQAWNNPAGTIASETLGDHAVTYATPAEAGMELTDADRRTLGAYRART
jgi:hypothetical protein